MALADGPTVKLKLATNRAFPGQTVSGTLEVFPGASKEPLEAVVEYLGGEKSFMAPLSLNPSKLTKPERREFKQCLRTHFAQERFSLATPGRVLLHFSVQLPSDLRPSFLHHCQTADQQFYGCVQHKLVAKLVTKDRKVVAREKASLLVVSDQVLSGYSPLKRSGHDYKTFSSLFSDKNITLTLGVEPAGLDAARNNRVDIEINALHAKSSLTNVKVQLVNQIQIRTNHKSVTCRRLVWETVLAKLLPKKIDYSNDQRFVATLTPEHLANVQQTISGRLVSNLFVLRLSVEKNHGPGVFEFGPRACDLLLPVAIRRSVLPTQLTFDTRCLQKMDLSNFNISKLDQSFSLPPEGLTVSADAGPSAPVTKQRSKSSMMPVSPRQTIQGRPQVQHLEVSVPLEGERLQRFIKEAEAREQRQPRPSSGFFSPKQP